MRLRDPGAHLRVNMSAAHEVPEQPVAYLFVLILVCQCKQPFIYTIRECNLVSPSAKSQFVRFEVRLWLINNMQHYVAITHHSSNMENAKMIEYNSCHIESY